VLEIRPAQPEDHTALGDLTASTYLNEDYCDQDYAERLRAVRERAAEATVLVALYDGSLVGGVTVATRGGPYAENQPPGTAVIRALVTAPGARGRGVGEALVQACLDQAAQDGCDRVRLSTQRSMTSAQRLYERAGFARTPEEDWSPQADVHLITYAVTLRWCGLCGEPGTHADCEHKLALEPPRYCTQCKRRMVVQVHPTGWSARCVEHGIITR
jgi:ribosomal protein S18 acetylase RimI-like enzyme